MLFKIMVLVSSLTSLSQAVQVQEQKEFYLSPSTPVLEKKNKVMMSFDGGGIRGIFSLTILNELENRLANRLTDYVGLFAGTSTGGMIALGLAEGKTSNELLSLYTEQGNKVFYRSIGHTFMSCFGLTDEKYEVSRFEPLLKKYYGKNKNGKYMTLADLKLADAMVVATDITSNEVKIFSSLAAKKESDENYPIWMAARATSAAPTYFEPIEIDGKAIVDGGLYANNPTSLGVKELEKAYGAHIAKKLKTVSIGTGDYNPGISYNTAKDMGILHWASPISSTMMSTHSRMTDKDMRGRYKSGKNYIRLNTILDRDISLDDASAENTQKLQDIGLEYIKQNPQAIDSVIKILVKK